MENEIEENLKEKITINIFGADEFDSFAQTHSMETTGAKCKLLETAFGREKVKEVELDREPYVSIEKKY